LISQRTRVAFLKAGSTDVPNSMFAASKKSFELDLQRWEILNVDYDRRTMALELSKIPVWFHKQRFHTGGPICL